MPQVTKPAQLCDTLEQFSMPVSCVHWRPVHPSAHKQLLDSHVPYTHGGSHEEFPLIVMRQRTTTDSELTIFCVQWSQRPPAYFIYKSIISRNCAVYMHYQWDFTLRQLSVPDFDLISLKPAVMLVSLFIVSSSVSQFSPFPHDVYAVNVDAFKQ